MGFSNFYNHSATITAVGLLNTAAALGVLWSVGGMPAVLGYKIASGVFDLWNIASIARNTRSAAQIASRLEEEGALQHSIVCGNNLRDCGSLTAPVFIGVCSLIRSWGNFVADEKSIGGPAWWGMTSFTVVAGTLCSYLAAKDAQRMERSRDLYDESGRAAVTYPTASVMFGWKTSSPRFIPGHSKGDGSPHAIHAINEGSPSDDYIAIAAGPRFF